MRRMRTGVLTLIATMVASNGLAHHSRVEFSDQILELEGEITEVIWLNPHPALFLRVQGDSGDEQSWRVEAYTGVRVYNRMGVTPDLFTVGERVRIAGKLSMRREQHLLGLNVLKADGREVLLSQDDPSYWNARVVIGSERNMPFNRETLQTAATENLGVFRVWTAAPGGRTEHLPYTDAAIQGREGWSPDDNPIARCEQPGMPVTMGAALPMELIDNGDSLTLHTVYFDTRRTIHIADAVDPRSQPTSHLGYSVGRWEGRTLVVETTRIDYPFVDNEARTPQSDAVHVVEWFTLSEDQSRLDYRTQITDPWTFTEPAVRERTYLALDEPFVALDCHVF